VIVATEFAQDPLLRVISEHTDEGNVAALIARSATLGELLAGLYEAGFRRVGPQLRAGLYSRDAAPVRALDRTRAVAGSHPRCSGCRPGPPLCAGVRIARAARRSAASGAGVHGVAVMSGKTAGVGPLH